MGGGAFGARPRHQHNRRHLGGTRMAYRIVAPHHRCVLSCLTYRDRKPAALYLGCFLLIVCSFHHLPIVNKSFSFSFTFQPLISCLGLLSCVHLTVTLGKDAYFRFLVWLCISICSYLLYSVHHTKEEGKPYELVHPESETHPNQATTV